MAVIIQPNFDSLTGWTVTSSGLYATPSLDTYWKDNGAYALKFVPTCGQIQAGNYASASQTITVPPGFSFSFKIHYTDNLIHDSDTVTLFDVYFDGNLVWSAAEANGSLDNRYWDCVDSEWVYRTDAELKTVTIDLTSYSGTTGILEFKYHSTDFHSHLYNDEIYIDNITESYTPISGKYFVTTGGNDSNSGQWWEDAWTSIDKAANTLTDGQEVHIEAGTYTETSGDIIAPVNAGSTGIKYTFWGTAGTGTADGTSTGAGPWDLKIIPEN